MNNDNNLNKSFIDMEDKMKSVLYIQKKMRSPLLDMQKKMRSPLLDMQKKMRSPLLDKQKRMRSPLLDKQKRMRSPLLDKQQRIINPIIDIQDSNVQKYVEIVSKSIFNNIDNINSESMEAINIMLDVFNDTNNAIEYNYKLSEKDIDNNVTDTVDLVNEIFQETTVDENIQQKIYEKCEKFKKRNPVIAFILMFIIQYLFTVTLDSVKDHGKDLIKEKFKIQQENVVDIKAIKTETVKHVTSELYGNQMIIFNTYRFINIEECYVRTNHYMKSPVVIKLQKGDIIKVIHKNNHWSYIEVERGDAEIRGWVNTIYTSRFDKS